MGMVIGIIILWIAAYIFGRIGRKYHRPSSHRSDGDHLYTDVLLDPRRDRYDDSTLTGIISAEHHSSDEDK